MFGLAKEKFLKKKLWRKNPRGGQICPHPGQLELNTFNIYYWNSIPYEALLHTKNVNTFLAYLRSSRSLVVVWLKILNAENPIKNTVDKLFKKIDKL